MTSLKKVVYFFCYDFKEDPVAPRVFDQLLKRFEFKPREIIVDGYPVMQYQDSNRNIFNLVRTNKVISHEYGYYLPILNKYFSDFDFGGIVNWHGGANALDKILCVHTTGDVESGYFGKSHPIYTTNLAHEMEKNRKKLNLEDFKVTMEATHWSGIVSNKSPHQIVEYDVPLVDIEIGSTIESWKNEQAVEVITLSLLEVFNHNHKYPVLLYVGGIHFEEPITNAVLDQEYPISASHILANRWVVDGKYNEEEGYKKLKDCINSIIGGIDGIVYQEKLKAPYREQCMRMGAELSVPVFKHKMLRNIQQSPIAQLYK